MRKSIVLICAAVSGLGYARADTGPAPAELAAVNDTSRPKADRDRDSAQQAVAMLKFSGAAQGKLIADFIPGGGYWTRLFSAVVGAHGRVYSMVPVPKTGVDSTDSVAIPPAPRGNVKPVSVRPPEYRLPHRVDIFWTSRNFRDFYSDGRPAAQALAKAMYRNLKPGGVAIIVDHAALSSMPLQQQVRLGRIDPAIVKEDMIGAGFRLEDESTALANPADDRTKIIIDPGIKGRTDQFALKFRKPS
jgi:predicted methyltransferase